MRKNLIILLCACLAVLAVDAQQLTVASYNIRYDNAGDAAKGNGWSARCPVVTDIIRFNDFDIVGLQEVLVGQLNDMQKVLPEYGYVGVGRDDGKTAGEYAPIFYKKSRFGLEKSGHFWLSDSPDKVSVGWDAALPRICTWALLEDKVAKKKVWFFNLHTDHIGVKARENSARLVLSEIAKMCGDAPVILTGDFNCNQDEACYRLLVESGVVGDSYATAATRYANGGTFNAFATDRQAKERIDYVFVTPSLAVERYGILTDSYWGESQMRFPSDHFPVKVLLTYKK